MSQDRESLCPAEQRDRLLEGLSLIDLGERHDEWHVDITDGSLRGRLQHF